MMRLDRLAVVATALALAACQSQPPRPMPPAEPKPQATATSDAETQAPIADKPASPPSRLDDYFFTPLPTTPAATTTQVLQRLRERMADPPCTDHPRIQYWQGRYAASPQRFARQVEAIAPMMGLVLDELDRYRLPGEYALLPIAESWYRPDARGAGDHVGLWQFGRSTAHSLGLPVNAAYDGRMDARASTDAAMRYLAQMHNRFGDWKLATAAFNAGPQRLQNLVDNQADALFSLSTRAPAGLPNTTFEHLAKMKALACLLGRPERFGILLSDDALDPLVPVRLPPGQSSLTAIAQQQEIPGDLLATLNPAFRKGFIASSAPRELLAPQSIAQRLAIAELPAAAAPTEIAPSGADMHIVRRGDTLGAIAKRHGVKLQTLFALNNLNARSVLRIGQRIRLAP